MSKPRPDIDLCNRDCFNCEYPDCILDGVTASDYATSRELDRAAIFDRLDNKGQALAAKQKAYYEANRDEIAAKQKAIQVFRKQRGYSQRAFAALLGVSQALISLWESGSTPADWMAISAVFPELGLRTEGYHA